MIGLEACQQQQAVAEQEHALRHQVERQREGEDPQVLPQVRHERDVGIVPCWKLFLPYALHIVHKYHYPLPCLQQMRRTFSRKVAIPAQLSQCFASNACCRPAPVSNGKHSDLPCFGHELLEMSEN